MPIELKKLEVTGWPYMSFGKLIYIVVFARLRQLAGQISKDAKDFLKIGRAHV